MILLLILKLFHFMIAPSCRIFVSCSSNGDLITTEGQVLYTTVFLYTGHKALFVPKDVMA
jgi:hypothetical protein